MSTQVTVAHGLARLVKAQGIRTIFSLSGNQIMPVYDGCLAEGLEILHCRHEGAAVFMADGYSQIARRPGIAMVTAGSGFLNSLGALFAARLNHSNLILLTGDSGVGQDGKGAFQELNQCLSSGPVTAYSVRPKSSEQLFAALHGAFEFYAQGNTGPVHIALAADVLEEPLQANALSLFSSVEVSADDFTGLGLNGLQTHEQNLLDQLTQKLQEAASPVLLLGPFFNQARYPGLTQVLQKSLGVDCFFLESPRGIADPHWPGLAQRLAAADLIVVIGKPVDFSMQFGKFASSQPKGPQWLLVDNDPLTIERFQSNLPDQAANTLRMAPRRCIAGLLEKTKQTYCAQAGVNQGFKPVDPPLGSAHCELLKAIQSVINSLSGTVTLVVDGGEFGQWAQAGLRAHRRIINGVSGTIGGGLSYGIGALAADPNSHVLVIMGDGTVGFHLAEFETAARAGQRIVTIVGNDRRWNAEYQIQLRKYGEDRAFACELSDANYAQACMALGGWGERVQTSGELESALKKAFAFNGPSCIDLAIEPEPYKAGAK
ncbi:MAG: thiamine pyrophosphate-binding protein [Burkholderiaceae bacterium]